MTFTEEQYSPQSFRRRLKEIEPRLSRKKLDEIMRLHNSSLSQYTQRATVIEISTRDTCDYCKEPMKYAGSNDGIKVVRSCVKHLDLANIRLAQLFTAKGQSFGMKIETDDKVPDSAARFDHPDGRSEGFIFDNTKDSTNEEES